MWSAKLMVSVSLVALCSCPTVRPQQTQSANQLSPDINVLKALVDSNQLNSKSKCEWQTSGTVWCPGSDGTFPNPSNCRTFYNCCNGWGSLLLCPEHLLYNNGTGRCDYPEEANCCEFWEKDAGKLVADGDFT